MSVRKQFTVGDLKDAVDDLAAGNLHHLLQIISSFFRVADHEVHIAGEHAAKEEPEGPGVTTGFRRDTLPQQNEVTSLDQSKQNQIGGEEGEPVRYCEGRPKFNDVPQSEGGGPEKPTRSARIAGSERYGPHTAQPAYEKAALETRNKARPGSCEEYTVGQYLAHRRKDWLPTRTLCQRGEDPCDTQTIRVRIAAHPQIAHDQELMRPPGPR